MSQPSFIPSHVSLKEVFAIAGHLFKEYYHVFVPIGLLYGISNVVEGVVTHLFQFDSTIVVSVVAMLITAVASLLCIGVSFQLYHGYEPQIDETWKYIRGKYLFLLAVTIGQTLSCIAGLLLLIVPGLYLLTIFAFADIIVVTENVGIVNAFKESMRLVKGYKMKVFLFFVIVMLIFVIPGGIITFISQESSLVGKILNSVVVAVISPFYMLAQVGLYLAIKKIKEQASVLT